MSRLMRFPSAVRRDAVRHVRGPFQPNGYASSPRPIVPRCILFLCRTAHWVDPISTSGTLPGHQDPTSTMQPTALAECSRQAWLHCCRWLVR